MKRPIRFVFQIVAFEMRIYVLPTKLLTCLRSGLPDMRLGKLCLVLALVAVCVRLLIYKEMCMFVSKLEWL